MFRKNAVAWFAVGLSATSLVYNASPRRSVPAVAPMASEEVKTPAKAKTPAKGKSEKKSTAKKELDERAARYRDLMQKWNDKQKMITVTKLEPSEPSQQISAD